VSAARIGLLAGVCLAAGCGGGLRYTPTTSHNAPGKSPECDFDILTMRPQQKFVELGVVESRSFPCTRWLSEFRSKIRAEVCLQGGDAVVLTLVGDGCYVAGAVIKYDAASSPAAAP
jgi:hypothetical protein